MKLAKLIGTTLLLLMTKLSYGMVGCEVTRAAIDIGSGETKMKIYKVNVCQNQLIEEIEEVGSIGCEMREKIGFKEDVSAHGVFQEQIITKAKNVLKKMVDRAELCGARQFAAVATSAFRQSANGQNVAKMLANFTKVKIKIISQNEEAELGFNGALAKSGDNIEDAICSWDIGSSSMQIICSQNGQKKFYLGKFASLPFRDYITQSRLRDQKTVNPVNQDDVANAISRVWNETLNLENELFLMLKDSKVLGIGGVHYYAISKVLNKKTYTVDDLINALKERMNKSDQELGGGKYVDTAVTNILLVGLYMTFLNIDEVSSHKVSMSEGLVLTNSYWK